MKIGTHIALVVAALGALLGVFYSGYSSADFVQHMDRQLHPIHCSLAPSDEDLAEFDPSVQGCRTALFSEYSSFSRDRVWGGIPYSLFASGLFGVALILAIWGIATRRGYLLAPSTVLLFAGVAAAAASAVFFWIATTRLHAICKTCAGTYISSGVLLIGAIVAFVLARGDRRRMADGGVKTTLATVLISLGVLLAEMGIAVFLPVVVYFASVPAADYEKAVTSCQGLKADAATDVLLQLGSPAAGSTEAIMVLDPLCDVCKTVHRRLEESGLAKRLNMRAALLPLDSECNEMLKVPTHPGSCVVARAMLCAGAKADQVLEFAFENQDAFRPQSKADQPSGRIREKVLAKFPEVRDCIDSPDVKVKLNKALDFAVDNGLPLETPQIYIGGRRLCSEDTDLGLEYALSRLLAK